MFGIKLETGKEYSQLDFLYEYSLSECNPLPTYENILENQHNGVDYSDR